jgi:prolyl oligopeptidase
LIPTIAFAVEPKRMTYPATRTDPVVEKLHGVEIVDPYRWLEDADNPEVRAWVEKQNALTKSVLDAVPGREAIRERLNTLLDIGTVSAPVPRKGKYFYAKREGKQNQAILYVRDGAGGADRVLLDPNALAADGTVALDWWYPSRDGALLVYGTSAGGSEQSTLRIRDVASGKDLPDTIERTRACAIAWLPDGKAFYYTRYPAEGSVAKGEENYNRHVFFHKLGDDPTKDAKVFGEGRPNTDWPDVQISPDGRWLVVTEEQGWAIRNPLSKRWFRAWKRFSMSSFATIGFTSARTKTLRATNFIASIRRNRTASNGPKSFRKALMFSTDSQ